MMNRMARLIFLALIASSCFAQAEVNWSEVLGPSQGQLPAPRAAVVWQPELAPALAQARAENRPLFVTLRCLPCKQCSAFDKDVLEGGPDLDPLLRQFITVRLTSAKDIDLRLLPVAGFQDLDLSWWGYFLSPEGKIYGTFGGRDEVSDETRISKAALVNTLKRVLAYHYDPRRASWDIDGPAPDLSGPAQTPTQLPGYASWATDRKFDKQTAAAGCIHCHQVQEILRQPALDAHTFDKQRDLQMWPLPENVGLKVDRDDGLKITEVMSGSPADRAGIRVGDELAAAGRRKLFGQADFRGVLQRGPAGAGSIEVHWLRDGKVMSGVLQVAEGWRKTVLDWRMSISQGNIGAEPCFWPIGATAAERDRFRIPAGKMLIKAYAPFGNAKAAGLDANSFVVAIDGQRPDIFGRALLVWFRLRHESNDPTTVTVLDRDGKERDVNYKAGHWTGE